ncbi:unnamed protein product [Dovyalis caffra]|uniref:Alpha/beta hydrolase fold-3 domain-containing protein n=1 Tax=Dovyalis caffra TaxID=77055 RepID=A0AAV1RD43_9ROSI|nr:unnamed protein product [Dovyalis caffra]
MDHGHGETSRSVRWLADSIGGPHQYVFHSMIRSHLSCHSWKVNSSILEATSNIVLTIEALWRDTTGHPLVNPFGPKSRVLEPLDLDPILVVVGGSDLLKDRAKDYAERLKNWGKDANHVAFEEQQHGFFTINPNSEASIKLTLIIKSFVVEKST